MTKTLSMKARLLMVVVAVLALAVVSSMVVASDANARMCITYQCKEGVEEVQLETAP